MVIYIHGFGGNALGTKAVLFREYFESKNVSFLALSLSHIPELAMHTLFETIKIYSKYEKVSLIGSSLGGYYALKCGDTFNLPTVLISPSIYPYRTLLNREGISFYDNSKFEWNKIHVKSLEKYEINQASQKILLLLQKGDDLLDYKEALLKLPSASLIIEENGSHSFDNIERHFERINEFLNINNS